MLVLENDVIAGLAQNPMLTKEFPFLKQASGTVRSCCGGGGGAASYDFNMVKQALASLAFDRQQVFKQLVGHNQVKVVYHVGGQVMTVTF